MSFPRARIQRFNDKTSCAPPPGSYDPRFEAKVKGAVIQKSERFVEPKCSSVSSNSAESPANVSVTSGSSKAQSVNCLPVFRTPQLPRRVLKQANSAPQNKVKLKFEAPLKNAEDSAKEVNIELYEALLVERDNKDATIRENESHLDELYVQIRRLERDLCQLQSEHDQLIDKHRAELQLKDKEMSEELEVQENVLFNVRNELDKTVSDLHEMKEKCSTIENTVGENRMLLNSLEEDKRDLLLQVSRLKDKEKESQSKYEMDIKELDVLCKKLVGEMAGLKSAEDESKKELEEEIKKLNNDVSDLSTMNSDLDSKVSQKQQMILLLQSELSSAELELEECKSEAEKIVAENKVEKTAMTDRHNSEMEEFRSLVKKLEELLSEEREVRMQEVQTLEENVMNGSVVRENLETIISDKQSALSALNDKYLGLEAEFEKSCMEHKLVMEAHRLEMDDMCSKHEQELKDRADEMEKTAKEVEAVNEKYFFLKTEFEKLCLEQQLVSDAHRVEVDDICHNYEEEITVLRVGEHKRLEETQQKYESLKEKYVALKTEFGDLCREQQLSTEAHRGEMDDIIHKYEQELFQLKEEACDKEREAETKIEFLSEKCFILDSEYEKKCMEQKLMTESHRFEIDELHNKYEEELCEVKEKTNENTREMEKRIKEIMEISAKEAEDRVKEVKVLAEENLKEVRNTAEERIKEFEVEAAERIKDCETKVEVKWKEAEQQMHESLEKATQAEEDLRRMTHYRDEMRISNMENQLTIVDLQDKIDTLVTELNTAKETYEVDLVQAYAEHSMTKKQCKKLKIGISNIQASLEALRMRLLESERDVEQLTSATQQVQAQKTVLEEQVQLLTQELDASRQSMNQLETDTVQQIEETRKELLCKLEDFKVKADKNIASKEEEILEYRHKMEELSARIFELTETISSVEDTNTEHEREIEALTEKLDHQRDCAKIATQQIATLEASNAIYQHQIQALTAELEYQKDFSQKASDHIAALAAAKANQEKAICDLTSEIKSERQGVAKLNVEIDELTALMTYNSKSSTNLLSSMKDDFECYKEEMNSVILKLKSDVKSQEHDIEHKNEDICVKESEIKEATDRITELSSENLTKEEKLLEYRQKIDDLCSEIEEVRMSIHVKVEAELNLKLEDREEHYERLLAKSEARAALAEDWEKRFKEIELLIGPFREQLEAFDAERKALESQKEAAEGEMRELGLRYAEILGHQNHKQKIKHVMKLKEQNYELRKEVEKLDNQVRSQKRIIDKLKEEQRSTSSRKNVLQQHNQSSVKGKENLDHSPVRKSPVGSPNVKPLRSYR